MIIIVNIAIALFAALLYYLFLPAVTLASFGFIIYLAIVVGMFGGVNFAMTSIGVYENDTVEKISIISVLVAIGVFAISLLILLITSPLFMSRAYTKVLGNPVQLEMTEYTPTVNTVPLMDKETAELLMNRTLGTLVDEVSQFELGESTQINYQGRAIRVSPLEYGDFFKWMNNSGDGIPAYITVDMQTQQTEIHYLEQGMKYSPSAFFGKDLTRHLRGYAPSAIFGEATFEIDDEGNPLWIVPSISHEVPPFLAEDVKGIYVVDAISGDISYYSVGDVPPYIDNVYPAYMIVSQYDDYGSYQDGFLNSVFGQRGVKQTTEGYNYIPQDDDIYLYTGVTSVAGDESNIGFIYVNLRTKEVQYFIQAGAEEYSAMSSAEGAVQHLGYNATFPLLLQIEGTPTYCMALKDAGGLVKMYALVNVEQYQIVVTGDTINSCLSAYRTALKNNGQVIAGADYETVTGIITDIREADIEGTTHAFIKINNSSVWYELSVADNKRVAVLYPGESVSVQIYDKEDDIYSALLVSASSSVG